MRAPRRAFTLIEMVMVLVVIGVLLALGLPRLNMGRFRADSVAQLVRTTLQAAQRSALTRQHDVLVSFDTVGGRMRVIWDADNNGRLTDGERVVWTSLETGNAFSAPATGLGGATTTAIAGVGVRVLDDLPTVTLHRNGTASAAVEIYISTAGQGVGHAYRAIRVIPATGRTEWFRRTTEGGWAAASL